MKKIIDRNGEELNGNNLDLTKGYLRRERIFVKHHEATNAVEEKGHWETVATYPNGGKDVEWVVDEPRVEAKEAWDEYEEIHRFIQCDDPLQCRVEQLEQTVERLLNIMAEYGMEVSYDG